MSPDFGKELARLNGLLDEMAEAARAVIDEFAGAECGEYPAVEWLDKVLARIDALKTLGIIPLTPSTPKKDDPMPEAMTAVPDYRAPVWRSYFHAIADGTKTFEIRRDDRGFNRCDECDNGIRADWDYCAWCGSHLVNKAGN
jgi:hypothetical protein